MQGQLEHSWSIIETVLCHNYNLIIIKINILLFYSSCPDPTIPTDVEVSVKDIYHVSDGGGGTCGPMMWMSEGEEDTCG